MSLYYSMGVIKYIYLLIPFLLLWLFLFFSHSKNCTNNNTSITFALCYVFFNIHSLNVVYDFENFLIILIGLQRLKFTENLCMPLTFLLLIINKQLHTLVLTQYLYYFINITFLFTFTFNVKSETLSPTPSSNRTKASTNLPQAL